MKIITSIDGDSVRFDFPEISKCLHELTVKYLHERIERDRAQFWREDKAFKTRSECEKKAKQFAHDLTDELSSHASIDFQRTLRIPDDGQDYPLPPGLGRFPLNHVDDFSDRLPPSWFERGGAMLPIHQSEALWLHFETDYPVALKIGTGKICAVSGEQWRDGLSRTPQNYCLLPDQPWIDGYAIEKGIIRQFIAEPLSSGFTVEKQLTGKGEWGGIQLQAYPLDPEIYWEEQIRDQADELWNQWLFPRPAMGLEASSCDRHLSLQCAAYDDVEMEMGLAAGGRMKQEIYEDDRSSSDYIDCAGNRCFVHLCNSAQWELITGNAPPDSPPSARDYSRHGLPWFDYYDEKQTSLPGGKKLKAIKSVKQLESDTGKDVLPGDEEAKPKVIVKYIKD